jgi:hypothetical protein
MQAINGVLYRACGPPGQENPGRVVVTFAPTGKVSSVVAQGNYTAATKQCLAQRFGAVHVPSFTGPPQSYSRAIKL